MRFMMMQCVARKRVLFALKGFAIFYIMAPIGMCSYSSTYYYYSV